MENKANKYAILRVKANIYEQVENFVEGLKKDYTMSYEVVGKEEEQATSWRTGELLWEDEEKTIPSYRNKYDYVPKQELSDEDKIALAVIDDVLKALDKLC